MEQANPYRMWADALMARGFCDDWHTILDGIEQWAVVECWKQPGFGCTSEARLAQEQQQLRLYEQLGEKLFSDIAGLFGRALALQAPPKPFFESLVSIRLYLAEQLTRLSIPDLI